MRTTCAVRARQKAVENIIEFMGIGDLRDRNIEGLSKGLKQRVALGRAIIHDPELLILDEPAANLDPRARIEFRTLIRELAADGKTVLLSSHILTELSEICDSVAVIEKGRILATGTVKDILEGMRRRRMLSVRLAAPNDSIERFLLEQPGVVNVHDVGGRLQFEFEGDDEAGVAGRPPHRCRLSGSGVLRARGRSGGSVHRDHGRTGAVRRPGARFLISWGLQWIGQRLAQPDRGQGSAPGGARAGVQLFVRHQPLAGLAVAFFGAADALNGSGTSGNCDVHGAHGLSCAPWPGGRPPGSVQRACATSGWSRRWN